MNLILIILFKKILGGVFVPVVFLFFSKNSSISALITLLLGPVPVTLERSILLLLARLLARGEANTLLPWG